MNDLTNIATLRALTPEELLTYIQANRRSFTEQDVENISTVVNEHVQKRQQWQQKFDKSVTEITMMVNFDEILLSYQESNYQNLNTLIQSNPYLIKAFGAHAKSIKKYAEGDFKAANHDPFYFAAAHSAQSIVKHIHKLFKKK